MTEFAEPIVTLLMALAWHAFKFALSFFLGSDLFNLSLHLRLFFLLLFDFVKIFKVNFSLANVFYLIVSAVDLLEEGVQLILVDLH
jgi:hypothetical protein